MWLNTEEAKRRLRLPESFDIAALDPYIEDVVEEWLKDLFLDRLRYTGLLGLVNVDTTVLPVFTSVTDPTTGLLVPEPDEQLFDLVGVFLYYAAFADYCLVGDITATESGFVTKARLDSDELPEERRTTMYRRYKDKATRRANDITAFLSKPTFCESPGTGNNIRISRAQGRTKSLFDE